jgi:glycine dehydrogenase
MDSRSAFTDPFACPRIACPIRSGCSLQRNLSMSNASSNSNASSKSNASTKLSPFVFRHIGPREHDIAKMLGYHGYQSLDELTSTVVPKGIQFNSPLNVPAGVSEEEALAELRGILSKNKVLKSFIGQGYYGTHTPKVIQRNVLENPAWYTAYTPYQPEISQGRLEIIF